MAKATRGKFKCPRCDRRFSMAAHLARHKSTIHASKAAKKKAARKRAAKKRARPKRKARRGRAVKRVGRPRAVAARSRLQGLTLEELGQLITAARAAARRRMAELGKALK